MKQPLAVPLRSLERSFCGIFEGRLREDAPLQLKAYRITPEFRIATIRYSQNCRAARGRSTPLIRNRHPGLETGAGTINNPQVRGSIFSGFFFTKKNIRIRYKTQWAINIGCEFIQIFTTKSQRRRHTISLHTVRKLILASQSCVRAFPREASEISMIELKKASPNGSAAVLIIRWCHIT